MIRLPIDYMGQFLDINTLKNMRLSCKLHKEASYYKLDHKIVIHNLNELHNRVIAMKRCMPYIKELVITLDNVNGIITLNPDIYDILSNIDKITLILEANNILCIGDFTRLQNIKFVNISVRNNTNLQPENLLIFNNNTKFSIEIKCKQFLDKLVKFKPLKDRFNVLFLTIQNLTDIDLDYFKCPTRMICQKTGRGDRKSVV